MEVEDVLRFIFLKERIAYTSIIIIIIIIIISLFFEGNSHKIIIHDKIQNLSTRRPSDKHNIHVITILETIYSIYKK
jgi:hypothetical protein